ncbi:MAG: DUF2752 domain-containing protein [Lachnospiraceae bacterium]|nr:DUF2752 domain-containing protein [Lachnospiraceae bacterium]
MKRLKTCKKELGGNDKLLYELGLVALGIGFAAVLLYFCTGFNVLRIKYPCIFNKVTHLCCPGCGGTRALRALLHGEILKCLYDYPPLLYGIIVYAVFMVRCFLYRHFGIRKMKDGTVRIHMYIFIALVLAQWIVKLVAQIFFDYYWF